ncbi:hypothetical protein BKA65DRAFT_578340 [Rhexocercosporidium sp. MPI-PUGE-AT-0058]|nr:hypothetical protein BKA65DRAFT_578340 [Rhexocercosporidium sp. MPI-PUGE-AT-0058]
MKSFGSHTQWSKCLLLISFVLSMSIIVAKDKCALEYWKRDLPQTTYNTTEIDFINKIKAARRAIINPVALKPGELNCRYTGHSDTVINYYSCMKMAIFYEITIEKFFSLNPTLKKDCSNIQPSSGYCVKGFIEPVRATDGLCGPKNSNATCLGQLVGQCYNAATWKSYKKFNKADCAPGNCYEGACVGDKVFSTDGTCGTQHGLRSCIGKWGDCCHNNGTCGTGPSFCGKDVCQMGNCTTPIVLTPPTLKGNTTDGTCGGTKAYTCSTAYGLYCNKNGQCGGLDSDCGAGW